MVGALPLAKLGILAVKQLSKPIAHIIKERAKHSPFFRQYICMPPAQFVNRWEVITKMWAMNLGKPTNIPKLSEAMAIELGANLLGECVIYVIGASLLTFEYVRQSKKETAREALVEEEKRELLQSIQELALKIEQQDAQMRHLSRTVAEVESRKWLPRLKILSRDDKKDDGGDSGGDKSKPTNININNNNNNNAAAGLSKTDAVTDDNNVNHSSANSSVSAATQIGNYNPNAGILFKSLNLIEQEIFYSKPAAGKGHRIIEDALVYLKYNAYE